MQKLPQMQIMMDGGSGAEAVAQAPAGLQREGGGKGEGGREGGREGGTWGEKCRQQNGAGRDNRRTPPLRRVR